MKTLTILFITLPPGINFSCRMYLLINKLWKLMSTCHLNMRYMGSTSTSTLKQWIQLFSHWNHRHNSNQFLQEQNSIQLLNFHFTMAKLSVEDRCIASFNLGAVKTALFCPCTQQQMLALWAFLGWCGDDCHPNSADHGHLI